jgi:hypothetical protein
MLRTICQRGAFSRQAPNAICGVRGGRRIFAGDESAEYNEDSRNISLVGIGQLLQRDPSLQTVIDAEAGTAFERAEPQKAFVPVKDWPPPSR